MLTYKCHFPSQQCVHYSSSYQRPLSVSLFSGNWKTGLDISHTQNLLQKVSHVIGVIYIEVHYII